MTTFIFTLHLFYSFAYWETDLGVKLDSILLPDVIPLGLLTPGQSQTFLDIISATNAGNLPCNFKILDGNGEVIFYKDRNKKQESSGYGHTHETSKTSRESLFKIEPNNGTLEPGKAIKFRIMAKAGKTQGFCQQRFVVECVSI